MSRCNGREQTRHPFARAERGMLRGERPAMGAEIHRPLLPITVGYCLDPAGGHMADVKTAEVQDSAEATRAHVHWQRRKHTANVGGYRDKPPLTLGNVIHFIVAVFLLLPVFVVVAVFVSLGDLIAFIRYTCEATISSTIWLIQYIEECLARVSHHREDPTMLRVQGRRRAMGATVSKDWSNAGRALAEVGRAWSKTFGLGGLYASFEDRIRRANRDWRQYVVSAPWSPTDQPVEFPENYVVVDELPQGGSSARLYVVRKKTAEPGAALFVLKYFDLRQGGNLESVVRESHAAELAKRLGLIVESNLGNQAFWYVMPYYHGETLTKGVMRNFSAARETGALQGHVRMSLGYVHQLLQIIAQYHEAGVIHKDIKPDNLIIAGERIYLIDIGLMTPLGSMAQLTTHGTEYFRDPEMVRLALQGREVREVDAAKFDVYSIGAVLFFAVSGEFPTSGALSRLPNDVPLAVQWVVNRAMTGMEQRYANARAMLTDIDYLFWAASTGNLAEVKPADLPSFKGMPVPPHLNAATPASTTQVRERLAAAPGGYGAWYAAPQYQHKRGFRWGKFAAGLLVFSIVSATALGFVVLLLAPTRAPGGPTAQSSNMQGLVPTGNQLPEDRRDLQPWFSAVDDALKRPVQENRVQGDFSLVERSRLAERVASHLKLGMDELAVAYRQRWKKAGIRDAQNPGILIVWRYADEYQGAGKDVLERALKLEMARVGLGDVRFASAFESGALVEILGWESSLDRGKIRSHQSLASWFARRGEKPAMVIMLLSRGIGDGSQGTTSKFEVESHYPGFASQVVFPLSPPRKEE